MSTWTRHRRFFGTGMGWIRHQTLGRFRLAIETLEEALDRADDQRLRAAILTELGSLLLSLQRPADARDPLRLALAVYRELEDPLGVRAR